MNALKNIARNIQSLDEKKILFTVYKSKRVSNFIIDLNRIGQLFNQGIDTKGNVIGRYSIVTETVYNQNKKAGTPYTLKDTGEFYATFKIKVNSNADFVISYAESWGLWEALFLKKPIIIINLFNHFR